MKSTKVVGTLISDDELVRAIELRKYDELEQIVRDVLENRKWSELLSQIESLSEKREAIKGWGLPLRNGVIRDALINMLDLDKLNGLDGDLVEIFQTLDADNLLDLKSQASKLCIERMKTQVSKGNTFFLNIDELVDNSYAVLISDIIEARKSQLERITEVSTFEEACTTYYGFMVLTSGGLIKEPDGLLDPSISTLLPILKTGYLDINDELSTNDSLEHFNEITPYTRKLVQALLYISTEDSHTQVYAAKELGKLGDSRAVDILHLRLKDSNDVSVIDAIINALGSIGSPESFDLLCSFADMDRRDLLYPIPSIGGIRHPDTFQYLDTAFHHLKQFHGHHVIKGIAQSRDLRFIPLLERIMDPLNKFSQSNRIDALRAIKMLGCIDEVYSRVDSVLDHDEYLSEVIEILRTIPDFKWSTKIVKAVVRGLSSDYYSQIRSAIMLVPELRGKKAINRILKDHWNPSKLSVRPVTRKRR